MKTKFFSFLVLSLVILGAASCAAGGKKEASEETKGIKNIILLVGDGMGYPQLGLGLLYAKMAPQSKVKGRTLNFEKMIAEGDSGTVLTYPLKALVADSACAGSEYATGKKCYTGTLGLDDSGTPASNLIELAKTLGKSTGLVSDTRITHATPAAFAVHHADRDDENAIAEELLESGVDIMLSGGLRHFVPQQAKDPLSAANKKLMPLVGSEVGLDSKRTDDKDLLSRAFEDGYTLVFDRRKLARIESQKILGLFASSALPSAISYHLAQNDPGRKVPTLLEMTKKAIDALAKNPRGFFLMVEAGQIDWACHANDAGELLHQVLQFDETAGYVSDWAKKRSDTLVLVLSDHETGGFGFAYSGADIPGPTTISKNSKSFTYQPLFNFASPALLDKLYNQRKSLYEIMLDFEKLAPQLQTADVLAQSINMSMGFQITPEQAKEALLPRANEYYRPGHPQLGEKYVPLILDFPAFYPYPQAAKAARISRLLSAQQSIVWASGSHTAAPVPLIAAGPKEFTGVFAGLHHGSEIGSMLRRLWDK